MCGIAGIFTLDSTGHAGGTAPVTAPQIEAMLDTMPYRGPDARGASVYGGRAGLGHLRLSILDLRPESNQPFEIDAGAYAITFNGEIFNYLELRDELAALGHRFRTTSDTEVLLTAYKHWGEACVPRLNGMWAFVIYDRARDVLFCSRDRFGIKPLNYAVHRGRFLFASEIKAILAAAPELTRPDYASLSMMLRASIGANQEHSCFEGVLRVPAAHNLTVTRRGVRLSRYWDYPTETDERLSPDDAADGLRAQLVDSLRLRMRSDVPVGSTLSGGVDSSSIVCLLREFFDGEHNTFTAQYEGEACDESPRAEALAKSLGMTSNLIPALSHAFLPLLRTIIRHLESPLHNPAVFPLWNIMEAARRKVTVVLEGQGADELLAGYTTFCFPHAIAGALRRGDVAGAARELRWAFRNEGAAKALLWLGRTAAPWGHTLYRTVRGDEGVYAGPLRDVPWHDWERRDAPTMRDPLNRALRAQHSTTLIDLLHYGDAISMAHSIESRLPFLDHRLVEYAFRLPGRHKYRDGHGKAVLKRAVRGRVPEAILDSRRKLGFVVPIADWFRTRPDETVYPVLRSKTCRERGLFDPTRMDRAVRRHIDGHVDLSNTIYRWILTELWFQEFIDRAPSAAAPPARRGARPVAAGAA